jgi:PD-(D/E)XK nuclease superfamily
MSEEKLLEKLKLSHSEATSLNECSRQHFYAYILNLRAIEVSDPLQYGINGHLMLEVFYTVIKNKGSFAEAALAAYEKLDKLVEDGEVDESISYILGLHMQKYFMRYKEVVLNEWEILEVEKTLTVKLPNKPYDYGCKLDLIALFKAGEHKGKIGIVDHKFLHNFYTPNDLLMMVQLPRYKWAAEQNGYKIDLCMLAQIRYRKFKDYKIADLFRHEPFDDEDIPPARVENSVLEMFKSLDEAWGRRQLEKQDALNEAKRTLSRLVCKYCDFRNPCNTGLNGKSERLYLISDFKQSDYGYNQDLIPETEIHV